MGKKEKTRSEGERIEKGDEREIRRREGKNNNTKTKRRKLPKKEIFNGGKRSGKEFSHVPEINFRVQIKT